MNTATGPSWGEAESATVAELARAAVVEASGQSNVRTARVELHEQAALAYVLMLDGQYAEVWLRRDLGQWKVVSVAELA